MQQRWALLGFLTRSGQLGEFREQFFRAGHAHTGVLLVLSLVYFLYLDRTEYSTAVQWLAGLLLAVVQAFFLYRFMQVPEASAAGQLWASLFWVAVIVSVCRCGSSVI